MQNRSKFKTALVLVSIAALGLGSEMAAAQHGGGGGGGHAFGGGGHVGGYGGGHVGGYGGGYRGGYGYHGGYGYRGGYGWHGGYYGGWGWGLGLGLGLYFATLPLYYSTYWWGGVPYYYADNTYYVYDNTAGQYQTVAPPPGLANEAAGSAGAVGTELIAYPKNGQSADQQSTDKFECHKWAATQSGFDPSQGTAANATPATRTNYMRAEGACLEGRGYSVK
jgi:hypothetical protein